MTADIAARPSASPCVPDAPPVCASPSYIGDAHTTHAENHRVRPRTHTAPPDGASPTPPPPRNGTLWLVRYVGRRGETVSTLVHTERGARAAASRITASGRTPTIHRTTVTTLTASDAEVTSP